MEEKGLVCFTRDNHQVAYGTFLMSVIFIKTLRVYGLS